jgi:hypothetical protein
VSASTVLLLYIGAQIDHARLLHAAAVAPYRVVAPLQQGGGRSKRGSSG